MSYVAPLVGSLAWVRLCGCAEAAAAAEGEAAAEPEAAAE